MNPQILFNFSLELVTAGLILIFKGLFLLCFVSFIIATVTSTVWLMTGFFEKFEYKSSEDCLDNDKEEEGKGVLSLSKLSL